MLIGIIKLNILVKMSRSANIGELFVYLTANFKYQKRTRNNLAGKKVGKINQKESLVLCLTIQYNVGQQLLK